MLIEVWADVVCPWCYLGKRRLEEALAQFEHAGECDLLWRSFQLNADAPREGGLVAAMLVERTGMGEDDVNQMQARLTELAAQSGLEYHLDGTRVANTLDAHRLLHFAAPHGRQGELEEALFDAYFRQNRNVGDRAVLVDIAVAAGLGRAEVEGVLDADAYTDEVRADQEEAHALGAEGVPFVVVGRRYGVAGAQPTALFLETLRRAWNDLHPGPQPVRWLDT